MGTRGSKPKKQAQVLMLGLDGSGKTTLLYKLKYNESVVTVRTVGFNVETLETDRSSPELTVWDVGGQRKMRPHWKHYYPDTAGLMFVVDSWDEKRQDEACKELHRVFQFMSNLDQKKNTSVPRYICIFIVSEAVNAILKNNYS